LRGKDLVVGGHCRERAAELRLESVTDLELWSTRLKLATLAKMIIIKRVPIASRPTDAIADVLWGVA
jgi:hypothetical protein